MNSTDPAPSSFSAPNLQPLPPPIPAEKGDSTGGLIPYKNPHALTAYYLGLFSLIPVLGLLLGAISVPLGISGLKKRKANPAIRGSVHAWIGIVIGGISVLVHLLILASVVFAASNRR